MTIKLIDHHVTTGNCNTQWAQALHARGISPTQPAEALRLPTDHENLQNTVIFLHAGSDIATRDAWIRSVESSPNSFLCLISANGPQDLVEVTDADKENGIYSLRWTPAQFSRDQNAAQFVGWLTQQFHPIDHP